MCVNDVCVIKLIGWKMDGWIGIVNRTNPLRKLGVKFYGDLMCLKWNFGTI